VRTDSAKTVENKTELDRMRRRTREEEQAGASLSGYERDKLFLNLGGARFVDASGVSGLDDPSDGRAGGLFDYDRDGFLDVALVSSNAPMLKLFRNEIGCHAGGAGPRAGFVAVRFVGGNHTPRPAPSWSARDGYGAKVTIALADRALVREHRAGEGFAAQNSATLLIGVGDQPRASKLTVRWPSGRTTSVADVPAGTLLTVYENPAQAPSGTDGAVREAYVPAARATPRPAPPPARVLTLGGTDGPRPALRLLTTLATWCTGCRTEIPQLRRLREAFPADRLAMHGVPIDPEETREQVSAWAAALKPPYAVLTSLDAAEVAAVRETVLERLHLEAVPATVITDAAGGVLHVQWGPPTVSKIRELLARGTSEPCAVRP
jgi:hypothetical protein